MCKGPEVGISLVCPRKRQTPVLLKWSETQFWGNDRKIQCGLYVGGAGFFYMH